MAGFGDRPTPRPLSDPESAHPGALLWPRREDFAGNRWALKLPQPGSARFQGAGSYWQGWPS